VIDIISRSFREEEKKVKALIDLPFVELLKVSILMDTIKDNIFLGNFYR
jgi:hypothetical protein